jgi:hypothetical protein
MGKIVALSLAIIKQWLVKTVTDWDIAYAVGICYVCRLALVLQLLVVSSYRYSLNSYWNTNTVGSNWALVQVQSGFNDFAIFFHYTDTKRLAGVLL